MRFRIKVFLISIVLIVTSLRAAQPGIFTVNILSSTEPDSIPPDSTDIRSLTSVELAKEMVPGWNVGNSLEAIGGETAWGNPKITQRLIDSVQAAGFKAVRIPVAWSNFSVDSNYTIDDDWLDRVEEVVNYVLSNGMYAIINEHWDSGWIQPTYADSAYVIKRLSTMWKQIAIRFRDYEDYVLFAGTNEVMKENDWGAPTKEYYTVQNRYNQVFVNTVRATGGRNYYRHLVVQGFNTNINYTVSYFKTPTDPTPNRLMVEVHYYDPYNFTINESSSITQWGQYATDPTRTETWANETWANTQFSKMKTNFIEKGYAVILGEYGAMSRLNLGSDELNAEHAEFRRYYFNYVTYAMAYYGLVPFYWDNGYTGDHGMAIFNRSTGALVYPNLMKAILDGVDLTVYPVGIIEEGGPANIYNFALNSNYPNPFNPRTSISYELPQTGRVTVRIFDLNGHTVATPVPAELQKAGRYTIVFEAADLPSGVYFYQLTVDNLTQTRKMLLLK